MEYILDTDICLFYLRGKFNLNKKIRDVGIESCYISEITVLELIYGARKSEYYDKHIKDVDKIKELFQAIPIEEAYEEFAKEKVRLKKAGNLIPDFDLLIGVTSLSRNMKMVTNNEKHLDRIENIEIENWTKPEFNKFVKSSE